MMVVMITYCEGKKQCLLNKAKIKADSITYADKLYSLKSNVCKHSGTYDQSSHILESCLLKVLIIKV